MEVDTSPAIRVDINAPPVEPKTSNRTLYLILLDILFQLSITLSERGRACLDENIHDILETSDSMEEMVASFYLRCHEHLTEWKGIMMIRKFIFQWMYDILLDTEKRMYYVKRMRDTFLLGLRNLRIYISLYDTNLNYEIADIIFTEANRRNKTDVEIANSMKTIIPRMMDASNYTKLNQFITFTLGESFFIQLNKEFVAKQTNLHGLSWFMPKVSRKKSNRKRSNRKTSNRKRSNRKTSNRKSSNRKTSNRKSSNRKRSNRKTSNRKR